jgi:hypothetical protein
MIDIIIQYGLTLLTILGGWGVVRVLPALLRWLSATYHAVQAKRLAPDARLQYIADYFSKLVDRNVARREFAKKFPLIGTRLAAEYERRANIFAERLVAAKMVQAYVKQKAETLDPYAAVPISYYSDTAH